MAELLEEMTARANPKGHSTDDHKAMIAALEQAGFMVTKDQPSERQVAIDAPAAGKVKFAVVSDTHLGHKHQQLSCWRDFTAKAVEWGAQFILHGGDVVDGGRMHRDQEYELFRHGADSQARYAIENIPEAKRGRKVIPYHAIGGNHDGSFWNDAGANVLQQVSDGRPDFNVLGAPAAMFHIGGLRVYIMHPDGGPSYARSYRLQKIVEQFAPDEKPHILLAGHWHVANHLPGYRNVESFALPCFQSQTAYLRRKGLAPVIGGLFIEAEYGESGLLDMQTRWVLYRNPFPLDFP